MGLNKTIEQPEIICLTCHNWTGSGRNGKCLISGVETNANDGEKCNDWIFDPNYYKRMS